MNDTIRTWWPKDGGPIYAETPTHLHDGQWLLEPWNAISSLLIVAPAIYFLIRLRGRYGANLFLTLCIPLLVAGGLGSTFFHGFRVSRFLLLLDVLPTMILFLAVSLYFWAKVFGNWWAAVATMLLAFAATWLVFTYVPIELRTNVGYFLRGTVFFLPLVIILFRTHFLYARFIFGALAAFGAALVCRLTDMMVTDVLPMGSHFLWHAFTGVGGFLIAEYLLRIERDPDLEAAMREEKEKAIANSGTRRN
ncbi:MAG TPA: hypothetical protein VHS96_01290 [Bacteroidia bacterium]|nr:hypothetical protein [Bacteroidia bacterium]